MQRHFRNTIFTSVTVLTGLGSPAIADVTISNAATENMHCAGGVCAPTAAAAVLNVKDLESLLASGNVKITTTGSGIQATNIRLTAKLAWSGANSLTFDANKSVIVEKPMESNGTGGLSVLTNDGRSNGEFSFSTAGHVTFKNLSSPLSINGTAYTLVSSVSTLASAIATNPAGSYALANSYDAGQDGTYATPPIATVFTGTFNGLGNTISNLTINDPTNDVLVGLFAETANGATLSSIRLQNESVTGASGSSQENLTESIGGLVGYADGSTISHVFVSGVGSGGTYAPLGGVAGAMAGTAEDSGSAMSISGGAGGAAGGLLGIADQAEITYSYATGNVTGSGYVGGLVGFNYTTLIEQSRATGAITGVDIYTNAGGLVGINEGTVSKSSASGVVTCQFTCGGLAGMNGGSPSGTDTITRSYATGSVSAGAGVAGGLVGFNEGGVINASYATGSASGQSAGGLIGDNASGSVQIIHSYSSGAATAVQYAGGLIGYDSHSGSIKRAYWDMTTSGIDNKDEGAGNVENDPGIKGLSNTKFTSGLPKGFNRLVWAERPDINGGLPYLLSNPPPK